MLQLVLVGIGTGNPDHLTLAASRAIREADLILLPLKGGERASLAAIRQGIIDAHLNTAPKKAADTQSPLPTVAEFLLPDRDPAISDYHERVERWHAQIGDSWENCIRQHIDITIDARIVLLIWGDPSLYDSSLRIAGKLRQRLPMKCQVIPGITAIQALCAAHAIPLNTIGNPVHITTGRQLVRAGWPQGVDTIVVMLDGQCAFKALALPDVTIWWGAYVAMPEELLISGPLASVADEIIQTRSKARNRYGWIMDIYLLRRS